MKAYLQQLLVEEKNPLRARCLVREYLQARLLESFQAAGAFIPWVFQGGTALRFLYAIPRFSEDLDFALAKPGLADGFEPALQRAEKNLAAENYAPRLKVQAGKIVKAAWFSFDGLPHELGLSPQRTETLSVKIELDTRPPAGAGLATSLVRRHITLHLQHHDRASLFAGKLHAVLARPYTKGRDLYDLAWYLSTSGWPAPNFVLLNNALAQTKWHGPGVTEKNWRLLVRRRLARVDWRQAVRDVLPFLERTDEAQWLAREPMLQLLEKT
jgi:hypothetical protein